MIIALPTKTGFVICADTRFTTDTDGTLPRSGEIVKLIPLSKTAVFAIDGAQSMVRSSDGFVLYDAQEIVSTFFKRHPFSQRTLDLFQRDLPDAFSQRLVREPDRNQWPKRGAASQGSLFEVIFFHVDESHHYREHIVRLFVDTMPFFVGYLDVPVEELTKANPLVFGSGYLVYHEVESGSDPRFDDLRRDVEILRFVKGGQNAADVSAEQADHFLRRFIKITSERVQFLSGMEDVSPESVCVILPRNGPLVGTQGVIGAVLLAFVLLSLFLLWRFRRRKFKDRLSLGHLIF